MPNHTANLLVVHGTKDDLQRVKIRLKGEGNVDFNKLLPMPQELLDICSGGITIDGKQYSYWREVDGKNVPVSEKELAHLMRTHGATFSNDWACEHWGTKWNAYSIGRWHVRTAGEYSEADIYFETAWSPPSPAIRQLSKEFPSAKFDLLFADEGGGFLGSESYKNGEKLSEDSLDWRSTLGIQLRKRLGRYDYDSSEEN